MSLFDNRVHLQDCENNNEVGGDTTAAPTAAVNDSGAVIEGTNSIAFQVDDAQEMILFEDDSSGTLINVDMSDVTVYMNVKHNLGESFANLGGQIVFSDGLTGAGAEIIGYNVNGNDVAGFPYLFRYTTIKLDVSVIVAAPGTVDVDFFEYNGAEVDLDHTAVLQIGYGSFNVEKAISTGKNAWIDGIYYIANSVSSVTGYAVSIEGGSSGTPETMVDVAADDVAVGMGLFNNPKGSEYGFFGPTQWGDGAAGDTYFEAIDNQWFFIGDNAGGHVVALSHFLFRLVGVSGSTNSWVINRVVIVNTGVRAPFDMSDAEMDIVKMTAATFVDLGVITMPAQDTGNKFALNTVFINGDQLLLSSLDMDGCTYIGTTDANGAIIWDETVADQEKQINQRFVRNGVHNAIEIAPTGAGPFTYDVDGLIADGFASQDDGDAVEAEKVFFINPSTLDADININLANSSAINIGGGADTGTEGFSFREVGSYTGTVTITQTVTLTITVADSSDGSPLEDVFVSIRDAGDNSLISEGRTNASGVYSDTGYNYTGDTTVVINVRKSSPGDTRYFPKADGNTIISTGMNASIQMTEDSIAGQIDSVRFDISKHGQISNDVSGATITAKIKLPTGSRRKLVVAGFYWDSTVNRTVSSFTFDGNAMTDTGGGNFVQEGSDFHEVFLYRHDIPDSDTGIKDVVLTLSGNANFRAIGFAIINLAATGAEEDDGNSVAQASTGNPTISVNNTTQPAISVMFSLTDDLDTFPPAATGVGSIRRADRAVDTEKQITIIRADRTTTGAHSIGCDYDASSKSYVSAAATFAD